jgi:hypothetical protein
MGDDGSLRALVDRFAAERIVVTGAQPWAPRIEGDALRFVAQLAEPGPAGSFLDGAVPGRYVVTYTVAKGLTARPATPARLVVSQPAIRGDAPSDYAPIRLAAQVSNEGDEDLNGVPILFMVGRPGQARQTIATVLVTVPAGQTVVADALWNSAAAGDWDVVAIPVTDGATPSATSQVKVAAGPPTDFGALLLAQGLRPFSGGAVTATITLIVAAATGFGLVVWRTRSARESGPVG